MRLQNEDHHNRRKRYRAKPSICKACKLRAKCTTSERGRMLYRHFEEDFYEGCAATAGLSRRRKPYKRKEEGVGRARHFASRCAGCSGTLLGAEENLSRKMCQR